MMAAELATPKRVFKLAVKAEVAEFRENGRIQSTLDATDGFVHLSNGSSSKVVAKLFFAEATDLVVLELDPESFPGPVTWMVGAMGDSPPSADQTAGPGSLVHYLLPDGCVHVYGQSGVPSACVLREAAVPLGEDGAHSFPDWVV